MTQRSVGTAAIALASIAIVEPRSYADLAVLGQFNAGQGQLVGLAFDHTTDSVWVYADFSATLRRYSRTGEFLSSVGRPGESANDVDIEIAPEPLMIGSTPVPAGTVLFVNGETDAAEVYAVDPKTGEVIATLAAQFGVSHVVGGAYHPGRDTFFLVQDRVPGGGINDNLVAEIDPGDGAVLNTFRTTDALPGFTVNFGDIEVGANGNLFIVSSDEPAIGEFTPDGVFVQELPLPAGVSSLSGIGMDEARGEAWVSGTSGIVWRLSLGCGADFNGDGAVDSGDYFAFLTAFFGSPPDPGADFDGNGAVDSNDYFAFLDAFFAGCP